MSHISKNGNMAFCTYLNAHLLSEMKWKSHRMGVSVNKLLNEAIQEYLSNHPRESEKDDNIRKGSDES